MIASASPIHSSIQSIVLYPTKMTSSLSVLGLLALAVIIHAEEFFCGDWEYGAALYQEEFAKWEEPDCYSFTYIGEGGSAGYTTVVRTVLNGLSFQDGDDKPFQTLTDVWNMIDEQCFRDCPTSGAYYCYINYATNTYLGPVYPFSIEIDNGETTRYSVGDVRVGECPEVAPEPDDTAVYAEKNPCVGWESNARAYTEAFAKWKEPACYTFTYVDQSIWSERQPVVQTVQNGTALQATGVDEYLAFRTLTDVWNAINESCVRGCPTSGAYDCQIKYKDDSGIMYPSHLSIDYESMMVDEEVAYTISIDLQCNSSTPPVENKTCVDDDGTAEGCKEAVKSPSSAFGVSVDIDSLSIVTFILILL